MKGYVEVRQDVCKGCGLCVSVCPQQVLQLDQSILNAGGYHPSNPVQPQKCIACAMCAIICPDSAIYVAKEE